MLKEICAALLEADVNIKLVKKLRENVRYWTNIIPLKKFSKGFSCVQSKEKKDLVNKG